MIFGYLVKMTIIMNTIHNKTYILNFCQNLKMCFSQKTDNIDYGRSLIVKKVFYKFEEIYVCYPVCIQISN